MSKQNESTGPEARRFVMRSRLREVHSSRAGASAEKAEMHGPMMFADLCSRLLAVSIHPERYKTDLLCCL